MAQTMNERLTEIILQMEEMHLSLDELVELTNKYTEPKTKAHALIHSAAMILAAKAVVTGDA